MRFLSHAVLAGLAFFVAPRSVAADYTIHSAILGDYVSMIGATPAESKGLLMEISAAAFADAGLSVAMSPEAPWARAQADAADDPTGVIVTLARTPVREPIWDWLTVTYVDRLYGYTVKGRPAFASFDEIKEKRPVAGVKLASAASTIVKPLGVEPKELGDFATAFRMLLADHLGVVLIQGMEVYAPLAELAKGDSLPGGKAALKELIGTPLQDLPLWLVASKKMAPEKQQRLQKAMETFKTTPRYAEIVHQYESRAQALLD